MMHHQSPYPPRRFQPCLRNMAGFTLIELMLAVAIVGVLASLAAPNYADFLEKARVARAISELHTLAKEIKGLALGGGTYPNSLADIGRSAMLDPWGSPYQYYKINCGTIDDISNLAKRNPLRDNRPRMILVHDSLAAKDDWQVTFTVDHGEHGAQAYLVAGGGSGGAGGGGAGGGGPPCGGVGGARKDRFLVPINSDFDIYSMGKDRDTVAPLNPPKSHDDVIRASDGGFYGLAKHF